MERLDERSWQLVKSTPYTGTRASDAPGAGDLTGAFYAAPTYAGCPHCRAGGFVKCGGCGKLSCWPGGTEMFTCGWCSNSGPVSGAIDSLSRID